MSLSISQRLLVVMEPPETAGTVRSLMNQASEVANTRDRSDILCYLEPVGYLVIAYAQTFFDTFAYTGKLLGEATVSILSGKPDEAWEGMGPNVHDLYYCVKMFMLLPFLMLGSMLAPKETIGQLSYPVLTQTDILRREWQIRLQELNTSEQVQEVQRVTETQNENEIPQAPPINWAKRAQKVYELAKDTSVQRNGLTIQITDQILFSLLLPLLVQDNPQTVWENLKPLIIGDKVSQVEQEEENL